MAETPPRAREPLLARLLDRMNGWLEEHAGRIVVRPDALHHDTKGLARLEARVARLLRHRVEMELLLRETAESSTPVPAGPGLLQTGAGPRVVLALLARDAADIVVSNIDFHLAMGVSAIIVTDNASTDQTGRVLEEYRKRGVIDYLYEPDMADDVEVYATRMARRAKARHGADWVIHASADEFWFPEVGSLPEWLSEVPPDATVVRAAARYDFVPAEHSRDQVRDARVRTSRSTGGLKIAHRAAADAVVSHRRDRLDGGGLPSTLEGVTVFHYPVRSFAQYTRAQAVRSAASTRRPFVPDASGDRWWDERAVDRGMTPDRYFSDAVVPTAQQVRDGLACGDMVIDDRMWAFFSDRAPARTATAARTSPAGAPADPSPRR